MSQKDWINANTISDLASYEDVTKYLGSKKCATRKKHLLLGNGFSVAYDPKIFSYTALSNFIEESKNDNLINLFKAINTKNFEELMRYLDIFLVFSKTFNADEKLIKTIAITQNTLKNSLIEAVKAMHPEHVYTIPEEKSQACATFLNYYLHQDGYVFSSNYDLLLYWVIMRNRELFSYAGDGFGRELLNASNEYTTDWEPEFSTDLRWGTNKVNQNIFYLHGALPLFDTGIDILKEEYDGTHLIRKIQNRMDKNEYPIFVTAGEGKEKLTHIMHNKYLQFCYEKLTSITGTLITYGFSFGENDMHIIDAINRAASQPKGENLCSLYIGVYSDYDLQHIKRVKAAFKIPLRVYNSRTVKSW